MTEELYRLYLQATGVSTDTRKIRKGSLFFSLKGPRFNANEFAAEALEKGASYAVIDDEKYKKDNRYVVVDNSLVALQKLANYHRKRLKIPFIAITGSNGKTTTKELMLAVLRKKYKTLATEGNLNNHIGVPLTILSITQNVQVAIIEMGANKLGDISELCRIAEPTHGLITNIGRAHIEGFGSFEGVIRGKSELYDYLIRHDGKAFINSGNKILANMSKRFADPVLYPAGGNYYSCELIGVEPYVAFRDENGAEVETNLVGAYNFENVAAALCVGKYFDVSPEEANDAVKNYIPGNNRSQVYEKGNIRILLDAYNANPSSMEAALENLKTMKASKKALIAGDMFELGPAVEEEHRKIVDLAKKYQFDVALFCGKNMMAVSDAYPGAGFFETKEALKAHLKSRSFDNYLILIKASRGMALEELVDDIH